MTDQPVYNVEFYLETIRKRQQLGASQGFVDIDDMMRIAGRVTIVTPQSDKGHSSVPAK
jgi:hypothetical protein